MERKHIAKHGKLKAHNKAMSELKQQAKAVNVLHTKVNVEDDVDYGERHDGGWEYDDVIMTNADLAHSGFTLRDPLFECSNPKSSNYFRHDAVSGQGPSFLVSNGIFNNDHHVGMIDTREILYHIAILLFLMSLTLSQQQLFADIIDYTVLLADKMADQRISNLPLPLHQTSPPRSTADFRQRYMRGSHSMSENLPIPSIVFPNGHAYVSIRDCIENVLGHGHPIYEFSTGDKSVFEKVDQMACVGDAPRMRDIV